MSTLKIQRLRKTFLVKGLREQIANSSLIAVAHVGSINAYQKREIVRAMAEAGGSMNFTKNTLAAKAMEKAGLDGLVPLMRGYSAVATGPAELPMAKALLAVSKNMPDFFVVGASLRSGRLLEAADIERITKLPPLEEVHTQLVSQMLPGSSLQIPNVTAHLIGHTQCLSAQLVGVLQAHENALKEQG